MVTVKKLTTGKFHYLLYNQTIAVQTNFVD